MNPPSDHPKTLTRLNSSALITRPVSSASWAISKGAPLSVESPMPRLSRRMISLADASRSTKEGSQSALVAAKPLRTSSGRPLPRRRQAIRPPSTAIIAIGSLAIGDHRNRLGRQVPRVRVIRQRLGDGGSSAPSLMLESGREAVIIRHRPAERSIHLEPRSILAEDVDLRMANSNSSEQPAWQRNPIFEFFASLRLAVVLLAVLILAAIAGTIYESSFDAKVSRAYVYGAPWFNLWLVLLGANLAVSALSRWPWHKHHLAFLITHLGIITLLIGSLIGRIFGIEGTMTLFKGEPPANRLLIDQHQLRVHDVDGIVKGYPAEFLQHPPNPEHPKNLGTLASGAGLEIVDYA